MPTENPFPLNIDEKQDTWSRLQLLSNIAPEFKLVAEEFNKMVQALNYLYENAGGSATFTSGEVRIGNYWFYPPNEENPQQITDGQVFRGFTNDSYVVGKILDATDINMVLDIDNPAKVKLFIDNE